ncbi:MAG: PIN domain-containing protein [Sphingomonas sp.]
MLIDTNVWSELLRPDPLPAVVALLAEKRDETVLSSIVVAEMEFGIAKLSPSRRREQLRGFVDGIVTRNADRLLFPDLAAAAIFGNLRAKLFADGTPIADLDLMIASQAIAAGMPLVTRNVSDMARTGATIINPWQP